MLPEAEVGPGLGSVSTRVEDFFAPAPALPSIRSRHDLRRADQPPQATERYAKAPFNMNSPLAFEQSRSAHNQDAQDLPDNYPLALNLL